MTVYTIKRGEMFMASLNCGFSLAGYAVSSAARLDGKGPPRMLTPVIDDEAAGLASLSAGTAAWKAGIYHWDIKLTSETDPENVIFYTCGIFSLTEPMTP